MLANLALVTVVTLLVWSAAESQTLRGSTVSTTVAFEAGSDQRLVRVHPDEAWTGTVEISLSGPTHAMDRARADALRAVTLRLGEELNAEPGEQTVQLANAIRRSAAIDGTGLTVVETRPPTVRLEVAAVAEVELPVVADVPAVELEGPAVVSPQAVRVIGPAGVISRLPDRVVARVKAEQLQGLRPGRVERVAGVGVELPETPAGAWKLRVEPPRVTVELTLRNRTRTAVIPLVPVELLLSPDAATVWEVRVSPGSESLRDVRVSGPLEVIDRLSRYEVKLVAAVRLTADELEKGVEAKKVELFGVPAGVTAEFEGGEIGLSVKRRPAPVEPDGDEAAPATGAGT